jgi:hypothetical protein
LKVEDVFELLKIKPGQIELVLTGRYAPKEIMDDRPCNGDEGNKTLLLSGYSCKKRHRILVCGFNV